MKISHKLLCLGLFTTVAFSANVAGQAVWNPGSFTAGTEYVVAGWNFNDTTSQATQFGVSHGSGTLTTNWADANISDFGGSSINAFNGDVAGRDIAFQNGGTTGNPANEGNWIQFQLNTTSLQNLQLSYAGRTTATGMRDLEWSFSTDGDTFTSLELIDHVDLFGGGNYGEVNVSFSSATALNNASSVFIRGTFNIQDGQSDPTAAGNTRFDNVVFSATAVPEPSAYAAMLGVAALALVISRRKARG